MLADRWSNGGVPTVIQQLSEELIQRGIKVSWVFYYTGPDTKLSINIASYSLNAQFSGDPRALIQLRKVLKLLNPTIIHDHFGGIWSAGYLFSSWKNKAILHYHNEFNVIDASPDNRRVLKETIFKHWLLKKYAKKVAVSHHNAQTILKQGYTDVEVIPNGIQLKSFEKNRAPKEQLVIGYLGRLVFEKGVDTLLETAKLLEKKIPINIMIAGDGDADYLQYLQDFIQRSKLSSVTFLGRIEDKESFFNSIDVLYFGSRQEPFGLTLLESWLHKTPVIGFYPENGGGPYEILIPGSKVGGTLLEGRSATALAELIERIHINREWIVQKTALVEKKLEGYSLKTITDSWIKVYTSISEQAVSKP